MKNRKQKTVILATAFLMLGIICHSMPVEAATSKVLVTDVDGDGTISVGDTFCLGEECFYVTKNADGDVKALAKYNLYTGYTIVDESNNEEIRSPYRNNNWHMFSRAAAKNGYTFCETFYYGDGDEDYKIICYKPIDYELEFFDFADNDDGYTWTTYADTEQYFDCHNSGSYHGGDEVKNETVYCYNYKSTSNQVKQDARAISAHGDERGNQDFPEVGDYFFRSYTRMLFLTTDDGYTFIERPEYQYYNGNNELVRTKYTEDEDRYRAGIYKNDIYTAVEKYQNYLTGKNYVIKDVDLMTYNELADVLTAVNGKGYEFEQDGYQCPSNDWSEDADGAWHCSTSPWIWQYYQPANSISSDSWVGYSSMLDYIPEEYQWIYDTSYWLKTAFWNYEDEHDSSTVDENVITRETVLNYQFFVDTLGDLCFVSGQSNCGEPDIGAGIRPLITIGADELELNRIDIRGSILWEDNNNEMRMRPQKTVLKIYRNNQFVKEIEVTDGDDEVWEFVVENMPKYDEDGNEYVYMIVQDDVEEYSSSVNEFKIVNSYTKNPSTFADNPLVYGGAIGVIGLIGAFAFRRSRR